MPAAKSSAHPIAVAISAFNICQPQSVKSKQSEMAEPSCARAEGGGVCAAKRADPLLRDLARFDS